VSAATFAEQTWTHYAPRPYVSGYFVWSGFDYRGEPGPNYTYPAINAQFGLHDMCGFPKDLYYYYQSQWQDQPVLHLLPHWNWPGKEGQQIIVYCFCNCEEVELFLNGQSQGRKTVKKYSPLTWPVKYAPGTLLARGYKGGQQILTSQVETVGEPVAVHLSPHKPAIQGNGEDLAIIAAQANDAQGRLVPTASSEIAFAITGRGESSVWATATPHRTKRINMCPGPQRRRLTGVCWQSTAWKPARGRVRFRRFHLAERSRRFRWARRRRRRAARRRRPSVSTTTTVYRGAFELPDTKDTAVSLLLRDLGEQQWIYLNGKPIAQNVARDAAGHQFDF